MNTSNADIRFALLETGIPHYRLAEWLGISASTLYRKMRSEMTTAEKETIRRVIEEHSNKANV